MVKVILFKSDTVGDLIFFSPVLKIIKDNFKDSHVTLVCSPYNFQIAKNYKQIDKCVVSEKNTLLFIIKNFKTFFLTKYDYLFQFDGKKRSYSISYFIKSKSKSTICFIKEKKIFNFKYLTSRPSMIMLKKFFNNFIFCDERYSLEDNKDVHYQANYFKILNNLDLKIVSKRNIFNLDIYYENLFEDFFSKHINNKYYIFHFDERWNNFYIDDFNNCLKIIDKISFNNKVLITTGVKKFTYLKSLECKYDVYKYENNIISNVVKNASPNILVLKNTPLNLLSFFIKNSSKNISAHTGPIVHISSAFNIDVIDIIYKSKNYEIDRWVPLDSKYKRINFEDLNENFISNFKF